MKFYLTLIFCILIYYSAQARDYKGEVIKVSDGDTLTMRAGNNRHMIIRLADIDAPEKRQPYGMEAKQSLIELVAGQKIVVSKIGNDRYKRTIGTVYRSSDVMNINRELTRYGNAWAYDEYLLDSEMPLLENTARNASMGLWGLSEEQQIPPWEWRKDMKQNK